jgi:histone deacetylase 1/2
MAELTSSTASEPTRSDDITLLEPSNTQTSKQRKDRVVYIYDDKASDINFSSSSFFPHSMKPYRVLATHELIEYFGLSKHIRTLNPPPLTIEALKAYHSAEYLSNLMLHNTESWMWHPDISRVNFSADCPPVEGIVEHSLSVAAGSLMGAVLLNSGEADVAIHWGGGMHHARCGECAGFCYVNDIALAIMELLKAHHRVLYVDIDIHHGDGVEETFLSSNRVFTLSLHRFGDSFFPGTGSPHDVGVGDGRWFSMNVPLWEGINDFQYATVFRHALAKVVENYKPDAIVMQCGADSITGDRVGVFNLSTKGHAFCVEQVRNLGLPTLFVGGGGYTVKNVARLWAYETSLICGSPVPLNASIDVAKLPLTGWLYEMSPILGIVAEELEPLRLLVHRQTQKILSQIDRHAQHIYSPPTPASVPDAESDDSDQ